MRKSEEEQGSKMVNGMLSILLGGVLGFIVCVILLTICSVLISYGLVSERLMYQITVASSFIGAMVGGTVTVRRTKARMLFMGMASGCAMFLLMLIIGALIYLGFTPSNGGLGLLIATLAGGAAAGILSARPKKKRRK